MNANENGSSENELNRDLVKKLEELSDKSHQNADCFQSAKPMVNEAMLWSLLGVVLWLLVLAVVA